MATQADSQLVKLFKALGDNSRLELIKALMDKPLYVEVLAERLNLTASTVSFHLKKLQDVGLVAARREQYYIVYSLQEATMTKPIRDLICTSPVLGSDQNQREADYHKKVLGTFLTDGKLIHLPVQRKKRRVILEYIAASFSWDTPYTEREFSVALADFHEDFCTLRREMICEKLFTRKNGVYYRMDGPSDPVAATES